jgi:putative two-component system response regulator
LVGRIVSVTDVFDALTHERPYKKAWPAADAAAEIARLSGRKFDPRVVDAFQHLLRQGLIE